MNHRTLLVLLLFPCFAIAEYKVPIPDNLDSSPPGITGKVISVSGNVLNVESDGNEVSVLINSSTSIFTVYGGFVSLNQVCKHSDIEIWYANPDENMESAFAAAIRVPYKCK